MVTAGLRLEERGSAELEMSTPLVLGSGPSGTRLVIGLVDGRFEGRLSGRLHGPANADWVVVGPDGTGLLDVRLVVLTDDGSLVYVESRGRIDLRPDARGAPSVFATTFETASEGCAWLNRCVAVTRADTDGTRLTYSLSAVVPEDPPRPRQET